jgi:hypothetical protein
MIDELKGVMAVGMAPYTLAKFVASQSASAVEFAPRLKLRIRLVVQFTNFFVALLL